MSLQYLRTKLSYIADFCIWLHREAVNWFSHFKLLTVLSFGPKILSANWIAWFFKIKYPQNGLIFWLCSMYNNLASWLEFSKYDLLTGRLWNYLLVSLEVKLVFPLFRTNIAHLSAPNSMQISSRKIQTVWTSESTPLLFLSYNFRSSIKRKRFIFSPLFERCRALPDLHNITVNGTRQHR